MKNITKLSERELHTTNNKSSWHDQYKDSAWIFVGGLSYDLSEGDIVCVFSQYGEIVNINLIRDKKTGKQKGFCFICFMDQRSTVLAVDNLNGIKVTLLTSTCSYSLLSIRCNSIYTASFFDWNFFNVHVTICSFFLHMALIIFE